MKKIIVLPFAESDIKDSIDFYGQINRRLKEKFVFSLETAFTKIRKNPKTFPKYNDEIRKYIILDFPFTIFYADRTDGIYVLAVFHTKRNPKIIKRRKLKSDL